MKFPKLFRKSNSSINQLQGNVLDCSIEQIHGNKVIVNTGMRSPFVCFQDELCEPIALVGMEYKFFCRNSDENQKARSILSRNIPIYNNEVEASQQGSNSINRGGPFFQASGPFFWGSTRQSTPWIRSRGKFTDELSATAIKPNGSFIPFLSQKQKLRHQIKNPLIGMRTAINCQSQERRGSFLHLALLRSRQHSFNHTEFNSRKGSELKQTLSTASGSGYLVDPFCQSRRREALSVESQRVGPWEITQPSEGNVQIGPGSQCWETQPEFLISGNKGYAPVKILGAQPRDGLLWIEARQRQNSTVDRTGIGFLTASRRLLRRQAHSYGRPYTDNKDSKTMECTVSGRPLVLRRTMTAGLGDLKTETFYYGKRCVIGVEEKRSSLSGELICSAPKSLEKISKRKIVWTEMSKLCLTSGQNRMKSRSRLDGSLSGFILNLVNGGYAVALAGYIAFLPKSLCMTKKVFIGQWRQFAIISMNPKIANIVVKEIRASLPTPVMGTARVQKKRRRRISPS